MTPHVHISAINVVVYALATLLVLGLVNLWAMRAKDSSSLAASWLNIYNGAG